ncbi:hypothetical protein OG426_09535 [Streptomyces canus]|uniref:hypothetical protein n=1 Tax=Streptomyces canus TaxID=58343 RepID=UPI00225A32BF|nr:hypothetical protein [Streptomyces canus]MCX4862219.1 hypothetical protein [Streptomyces canus]WSW32687.1 hypothetical protein OG426_09535 [Streptomyces canus]
MQQTSDGLAAATEPSAVVDLRRYNRFAADPGMTAVGSLLRERRRLRRAYG